MLGGAQSGLAKVGFRLKFSRAFDSSTSEDFREDLQKRLLTEVYGGVLKVLDRRWVAKGSTGKVELLQRAKTLNPAGSAVSASHLLERSFPWQ